MQFANSLVYVDVTNRCHVGCSFCMYKAVQGDVSLSLTSERLLAMRRLSEGAATLCISGEGEPLHVSHVVLDVLRSASSDTKVEIITSASVPRNELERFLTSAFAIAAERQAPLTFRVSLDRWHIAADRFRNFSYLFDLFENTANDAVQLSLRSVTTEMALFPRLLRSVLGSTTSRYEYVPTGRLSGVVAGPRRTFPVAFKNCVEPANAKATDPLPLRAYIEAVESVLGRRFTFGRLVKDEPDPGLDITVKPDGRVLLYGVEPHAEWTLDSRELSLSEIQAEFSRNAALRLFYTVPFADILSMLEGSPEVSRTVARVNNPYWVLKTVAAEHPAAFAALMQSLVQQHAAHPWRC